jgi:type IV pilus assembly protein PilQ
MTQVKTQSLWIQSARRLIRTGAGAAAIAVASTPLSAANVVQNLGFNALPGGEVDVVITLKEPAGDPQVFTTDTPARIAVDFSDTSLGLKNRSLTVGSGATKSISAIESGGRSRVVIDLYKTVAFDSRMDGNRLIIHVANGFAGAAAAGSASATSGIEVSNIDFRRGKNGEGRIMVSFSADGASADLRPDNGKLVLDLTNAKLPSRLSQRLDVGDFATPVQSIESRANGAGTRLTINATGQFEHMAYQAGNEYVLEISQKKAEEKRMPGDAPVYTGERVTFNFQDIPVRSLLQLIADLSKFNIVVADSVQGNVTLRLENVPWDQALDTVLQAKGLDKRRSGNVLWVAPTKEIADREQALEELNSERQRRRTRPRPATSRLPFA